MTGIVTHRYYYQLRRRATDEWALYRQPSL